MDIAIGQSANKASDRENYWNWSVWIKASDEIIQKINYVEYILHASFKNRVRTISSKKSNFKLSTKGWGEFTIFVNIYINENEEPILLSHDLKLFDKVKNDENKTVFISSTLVDEDNVEELTDALIEKKINIESLDSIGSAINSLDNVNKAIKNSDIFILYAADNLTRNQKYELDLAVDADKEIIIKLDNEDEIDSLNLSLKNAIMDNIKILKTNDDIIENF